MKKTTLITYDRQKPTKQHNKLHRLVYNTTRWRELRKHFLSKHPLCERCRAEGIVKLAEHVHHMHEISDGLTDSEIIQLGFDVNNLEAICKKHHTEEHNERRATR